MATNRWISKAQKTAQVNTATPANVGVGNTFTLTINGKSETFTATAATVANVTAGLPPLWNGSDEGEMDEVTAEDSTTLITLTADEPGIPFTQTSSATGGTATLTTATTVANSSPNDINNATNWTDGVPTASDDLVLDEGGEEQGLWWNLGALSAVTVGTLVRRSSFTGKIGLPEYNEDGSNTFFEYRATELAISITTALIEQPASDEAEHIKLNVGTAQTALTINGEGSSSLGEERLWWRGTHASNVVNVNNGSIAVAVTNLNAATIATLRGENSTIRCGSAVTLTTVTLNDCVAEFNCGMTTLTIRGDNSVVYTKGTAAITTANVLEGQFVPVSNSTIATIVLGPGATVDWSQGTGPVTVTNAVTFNAGITWKDPEGRVTLSGGYVYATGVRQSDCTVDMGTGRTHTVS